MNSRQIEYAILLSQHLNFSQVADELGISQPSLSKQIISLENELGVKLFDRNHSPLTLTPAGEYFVKNAQELLYKESEILKALSKFQSGENGSLVIGVTPFRSLYLMPEIIKKIKAKFPGVRVTLHEATSAQLRKEASEGKFDFAIVNLPVDESILNVKKLEPDTLVLAVESSMAKALNIENKDYVDFKQFASIPFVVLSPAQELRQLFDKLCTNANIDPDISAEVVGVTTAWALAKAGVGAALLPLQFIQNQFIDKDLTLYKIKNNLGTRQPAIVRRKDQYLSDYAKYAIKLLTE
ncbi:MAG: LysR family transcriptional regulator [Ruminococcaceae bacterium]|nr:LysR family transcriptional regulator [Oscillospiraceae bacterium]